MRWPNPPRHRDASSRFAACGDRQTAARRAGWRRRRPRLGPPRPGERGSSIVELALVLPLMLLLAFGIFDFGRLFFVQLTLTSAIREASRFGATGNALPGQTRVESIIQTVSGAAPGLGVEPANITISGPGGPGDAGGPGDLVTIQVDYDVGLITPLIAALFPFGSHHFTITIIAQNEPFPEG